MDFPYVRKMGIGYQALLQLMHINLLPHHTGMKEQVVPWSVHLLLQLHILPGNPDPVSIAPSSSAPAGSPPSASPAPGLDLAPDAEKKQKQKDTTMV